MIGAAKQFFIAGVGIAVLDAIWFNLVAASYWKEKLGHLLRMVDGQVKPVTWAFPPIYILVPLGIVAFVLPRAEGALSAALWGALYGVIVYGVFEFTNVALIDRWPASVIAVDIAWGAFACGVSALLAQRFGG